MNEFDSGDDIDTTRSNKGRPDLDSEEYRDSTFYKPISTREYFKLLGYCVIGLVVIGLAFVLLSVLIE